MLQPPPQLTPTEKLHKWGKAAPQTTWHKDFLWQLHGLVLVQRELKNLGHQAKFEVDGREITANRLEETARLMRRNAFSGKVELTLTWGV